ncbi:MAG: class I SAM-dependent methyltransferase [Flavobacteriales bacterium]|nr:class I SAM-dependent methyltransferase [Flavobacteriales bacterium]
MQEFTLSPERTIEIEKRHVHVFKYGENSNNIDFDVVDSFGEEWKKFQDFDKDTIDRIGIEYFDILLPHLDRSKTYLGDFGCGTGRWSKFLSDKVLEIEAIDPSEAIYSAAKLLAPNENIRLSKTSIDVLPFRDGSFDVVISVGVLHHIPDTEKAMRSCVEKVKMGGHCFFYLYYNLEGESAINRMIFKIVTIFRRIISRSPSRLKKLICDLIAYVIYFPLSKLSAFVEFLGLKKVATKMPLSYYRNKSIYIMRNDSLDRFGTSLEQRFSKTQIHSMMKASGLEEIQISEQKPKYCAVGKRVA